MEEQSEWTPETEMHKAAGKLSSSGMHQEVCISSPDNFIGYWARPATLSRV